MKKRTGKIIRLLRRGWKRIVRIKDSPHKIASGFGVGVFFGFLPGTGPIASVVAASMLKINRTAALAGGLAANTWLSLLLYPFSLKIGGLILGVNDAEIKASLDAFFSAFTWKGLFSVSALKLLIPVITGFFFIGIVLSASAYAVVFIILKIRFLTSLRNIPSK